MIFFSRLIFLSVTFDVMPYNLCTVEIQLKE
jgi:hypothetical protein